MRHRERTPGLAALPILGAMAAATTVAGASDNRSASAIAITADGATLVVVNPDSGTVSLVDTGRLEVSSEIAVGEDPRTVAVATDGREAWVANHGSRTVSLIDLTGQSEPTEVAVGDRPYGIVSSPDGRRVYVTLNGEGLVAVIDAPRRRVVRTIAVGNRPAGIAIGNDGSELYATHLLEGVLTVIDLDDGDAVTEVALWPDSNLLQSVVPTPDGLVAFLPHTRSNTRNTTLTFDTTVFPLVSKVDLVNRQHLVGQQISLDTVDPPGVGLPFDASISDDGSTLWVVNAASNDLTVVDLRTGLRLAHIEVGANPRGIVLAPDGSRAFVNNTLDGTVSVIDTTSFAVTVTVRVTTIPLPPVLLTGKRLFHSSDDPRLAKHQWIACTSCHFDGEHDGRTWFFNFAGPRNTTSLRGMVQSYPLRWSAEWDESADSDFAVTREQFGSGLIAGGMHPTLGEPNSGLNRDLDSLAAYIDSLEIAERGRRGPTDPGSTDRGRAVFEDPVVGCADCHPRPYYTDFAVHDVGTADGADERLGPEIDTPTLRDLARSAPYLHDGSAPTLADVLTTANPADLHGVTSHLDAGQLEDLAAFMLWIPANNHACVGCELAPTAKRTTSSCVAIHPAATTTTFESIRRPSGRLSDRVVVTGRVISQSSGSPVPGALVTLRATEHSTETAGDGSFSLGFPSQSDPVEITAWSQGHYVASTTTAVPAANIELALRRYHTNDNPDYQWVDPTPEPASGDACGNCHPSILPQWNGNAHGGAVSNPRFFSFYNGTDLTGSTIVAPGYRLDFPGTAGNCATCHAPAAAVDAPFTTDMNSVRDRVTAGIHCDFCHKIGGAWLATGARDSVDCGGCHKIGDLQPKATAQRPYPNSPGVMSLRVLRPPAGEQIFFGPYPDIHDPDAYLPLTDESAFCAPCHQFSFWGTPIYTSYDEWLASPYSDPETGRSCQDCHMPPNGDEFYAIPSVGGLAHPPETIPSHLQLGLTDVDLMQSTVDLVMSAQSDGSTVEVTVTLTNTGAGHHVPTDHPGRHLLLVIEATDQTGAALGQLDGPTLPVWGGDLAGRPGTGFAKILQDVATGESPVVSYWKQALILEDTRLPALGSHTSTFRFSAPTTGGAEIGARLVFRRLFEDIADRYGWPLDEVVMAEDSTTVGSLRNSAAGR